MGAGSRAAPAGSGAVSDGAAALLVLGRVCTAAAFVIYSRLVAEIGPGRALVITYVRRRWVSPSWASAPGPWPGCC